MSDDIEFTENGVTWRAVEAYRDKIREVIIPLIEGRKDESDYKLLKENPVRTVMSINGFVVKVYRVKKLTDKLRYMILSSKAGVEWEMAAALGEACIPSVTPVAYGEKRKGPFLEEAYFVSLDLGGVSPLKTKVAESDPQDRLRLAEAAAELAYNLHSKGFYHMDLHGGNVMVDAESHLHLVDLHRMSTRIGWRGKVRNLATLFGFTGGLFSDEEAKYGIECYCRLAGIDDPKNILSLSSAAAERIRKRHLASRSLRCIKESSRYTINRRGSTRIYHRRCLTADDVTRIGKIHDSQRQGGSSIRDSKRSVATRVECDWMENSPSVFVKEEKPGGFFSLLASFLSGSRTKHAWLASSALAVRGISTPEPLVFVETSRLGTGNLLVTRFVEDAVSIDQAIEKLSADKKFDLISGIAALTAALHRFGIYHSDWSSKNFLVAKNSAKSEKVRVYVIDTESVRPYKRLTRGRIIKNLGQLNDISGFTASERMRFYDIYGAVSGVVLTKKDLRKISEYTRQRVRKRRQKVMSHWVTLRH